MTREEAKQILEEVKTMDDSMYQYNKAYLEALDMAIKALKQEPITKNDLALINTEGLDEGIRCAMCTNSMANDRGCDGSCVVNKDMYKAVMDAIEKRIQPTTKNDLVVDCISRKSVITIIQNHWWNCRDIDKLVNDLPSVTPQEPILDKIRSEIEDWQTDIHDNEYDAEKYDFVFEPIYASIDKYRTESEGK